MQHSVEYESTLVNRARKDSTSEDHAELVRVAVDLWHERGMTLVAVAPNEDDPLYIFRVDGGS